MSTLLENVAYGHTLGWSFTPLNGKRPKLKEWQKAPRETAEQARQWAGQGNVGLRTGAASGIVVIDADAGSDLTPLNLPGTVSVYTGGNGTHLYYRCSRPLGNSASKLGPHIDVRGDGGQVVYPGSVHPDTKQEYRWCEGYEPWAIEIAELPGEIYDRLTAKPESVPTTPRATISDRYVAAALRAECDNVEAAVEGQRNATLNKAAFSLGTFVGAGKIAQKDAHAQLLGAAMRCGLPMGEANKTIASGLEAGAGHPRAAPAPRSGTSTPRSGTPTSKPHANAANVTDREYVLTPGQHIDDGGAEHAVGTDSFATDVLDRIPPDTLYRRGNVVGRLTGEHGSRQWQAVTTDELRTLIDANMQLGRWEQHKGGSVQKFLPCSRDWASIVLAAAKSAATVRDLHTMVNYPTFVQGWRLAAPGWQDGVYYDESPDLADLPIEHDPEVIHNVLHDLVVDFPFKTNADRHNFFGLMLTPIIAPAIGDNRPLHLIGASIERTGKTKLAETVLGGVILGRPTAALQIGEREDERDKRILSMLLQGESIMHLDNLPPWVDSAALASLLTSRTFSGRILGRSEMASVPNTLTIVASGNNIHATGELVKRTVPILLQPASPHPERRRDFQHANLPEYVRARRRDVLGCLIGMVENWLAAGRPIHARRMGGFESWAGSVGQILAHNGLNAWLTNQDSWQESNDPRGAEMAEFVEAWWGAYEGADVLAKDLRALAHDREFFDYIFAKREPSVAFGRMMASYADRPVAEWIVRKLGPRNHAKYKLEKMAIKC